MNIKEFEEVLDKQLDKLHSELKEDTYSPQPVRQRLIPKAGQPGKFRQLGIPNIYDRLCQQAFKNRLEPIFDPLFDDANYGYRCGRSTKDALRKVWREIEEGDKLDSRCRFERLFRVGGSLEAYNPVGTTSGGRPCMRTRMYGGVGGEESHDSSLSRFESFWISA